ncbi:LAMI_0F01134g1_1 [Lachancea mirantina]|uniref:LAMI_0F01134g1_1 n=1 Tax=Lachancea mirantina TaxID=1230905 RepID=A0A1G4JVR1_9SACH|nr:LAMI_0F01134g1_1 [Lachancea mirantina]
MASQETIAKVKAYIAESKIFIASKTYCPYCQATLKLIFEEKKISKDQAVVLQLNQMEDGAEIQEALTEITGQRTVPNVFIGGEHIGGNSELQALNASGKLDPLLEKVLKQ